MSEALLFPAVVIAANVVILVGILGYVVYCKTTKCNK